MTRDVQPAPQSLAGMELFRGLPPSAPGLGGGLRARVRRLPKDMRIFNQGDDSVRAHAIIEGRVRIAQLGSDGAQVVIRFIGPAEMFGTVALFIDGLAKTYWSRCLIAKPMSNNDDIGCLRTS